MILAPGRFDYAPITERPVIRWPGSARVAFWVAPNMEFFEYMPESRPNSTRHSALRTHGLRQSRWLLAHARRVEQA